MRISGGDARGVRLKTPPKARPTSERVRHAIFASLAARIPGARVLDLYCGSGSLGLEALSRGADEAVFVDKDPGAVAIARANAKAAGADDVSVFHRRDVRRYVQSEAGREGPFDLVFIDAPYAEHGIAGWALPALVPAVADGGRVVLERRYKGPDDEVCEGFVLEADRRYGDTRILVFRRGVE